MNPLVPGKPNPPKTNIINNKENFGKILTTPP